MLSVQETDGRQLLVVPLLTVGSDGGSQPRRQSAATVAATSTDTGAWQAHSDAQSDAQSDAVRDTDRQTAVIAADTGGS